MNTSRLMEGLLGQGLEQRTEGRLEEAIRLFGEAITFEPESAEAHYQMGYTLSLQRRFAEAEIHARRAITLLPGHAQAHNNLGYIALQGGRLEEAVQHYGRAIALKPDYAKAHCNLGLIRGMQGRLQEAIASFRAAIAADPRLGEAYFNLANLLLTLARLDDAADCYRQALVFYPDNVSILQNLGNTLAMLGKKDEAVECYRQARALQPDDVQVHYNLGGVLSSQGKLEEAIACYRRALELKADHAEALYELANALASHNELEESGACYRRAISIRPGYAEALYNLGGVLNRQGRLDDALACFHRALEIKADYAEVYCNMGFSLGLQGRPAEAIDCCREAIRQNPDLAQAHSSLAMMLLYTTPSPDELFSVHRAFAERFEAPLRPKWPAHRNPRDPDRRLKVGYVSSDFRLHSVAFFLEPILAHHDKTRVEITGYHSSAVNDAMTDRLRGYMDRWVPCAELSDAALAERIREDGIDILVDLAGHTGVNRLLTFARKPAPVQVTYLGYPATTGLAAMDYRLTTWDIDPEGGEVQYAERLLRLPRTLWCYRPPADVPPALGPAPGTGRVTFGSMNNIFKVSEGAMALWARILAALPESRLVMTAIPMGSARERLYRRFADHGIGKERLSLHDRLPADRFHAVTAQVDIALDPFPYNGTTTTCEALWMGIPVVTLVGQTSVSRSGYALLRTVGLGELCARDESEYLRIAVELATDVPRRNTLRQGMRARIEASPLRDEAGLARDLETAYREMWRAWCRSERLR